MTNQHQKDKFSYSDLEKLHNDLTQPMVDQLYQRNLAKIENHWKEKYNLIKDVSWPPCNSLEEFENLPAIIKNECIEVHNFSPEIWKKHLMETAKKPFPWKIHDRASKVIADISNMIIGKDIIDFACNKGQYSFACWKAGAKSVLGFDIRKENIIMANAMKNYYDLDDAKIEFILADIHDYDTLFELCKNKQTALIPGVLYHVHDHYEILKTIAKTDVQNIIIETGEYPGIMDSAEPLVWWLTEPTFDDIAGWHNNESQVPVGFPNLSWFKMIMSMLKYNWISTSIQTATPDPRWPQENAHPRSIHVFQR